MKIKPEDMAILREFVAPVLAAANVDAGWVTGYIAENLSTVRFRWDALRASGVKIGDGVGVHGHVNLYAYCNDEHIDTALRQLCREAGGHVARAAGIQWGEPVEDAA